MLTFEAPGKQRGNMEYWITASVTDSGGLPGSQQITVTVTANVAPQVLVTSPADGSTGCR